MKKKLCIVYAILLFIFTFVCSAKSDAQAEQEDYQQNIMDNLASYPIDIQLKDLDKRYHLFEGSLSFCSNFKSYKSHIVTTKDWAVYKEKK